MSEQKRFLCLLCWPAYLFSNLEGIKKERNVLAFVKNQRHGRFNNLLQEHQSHPKNAIAEETKDIGQM